MAEIPIEDVIRACMACRAKLGSFRTTHRALLNIANLNQDQQVELARKMSIDPTTLRGLVMMCGYACNATDWLLYHETPLARESYKSLVDELQPRVKSDTKMMHPLFRELCWGAQEILRLVDWDE